MLANEAKTRTPIMFQVCSMNFKIKHKLKPRDSFAMQLASNQMSSKKNVQQLVGLIEMQAIADSNHISGFAGQSASDDN